MYNRPLRTVPTTHPVERPDGTVLMAVVTGCCGTTQYRFDGEPLMCMSCGTMQPEPTPAVERSLAHLRTHLTRYWS